MSREISDIEQADILLAGAGIRTREARSQILAALIRFGNPVSHSQLKAVEEIGQFDRVTIYRTLKTLQQGGLVHAVQGTDGITRYCAHFPENRECPANHPHFICRACGNMICLPDQQLSRVDVPDGFSVEGKQYLVFGLCGKCSAG